MRISPLMPIWSITAPRDADFLRAHPPVRLRDVAHHPEGGGEEGGLGPLLTGGVGLLS